MIGAKAGIPPGYAAAPGFKALVCPRGDATCVPIWTRLTRPSYGLAGFPR